MLVAICGKSNSGKSTFFSASTLVDVEISNRIFTTIKPNRGVSYVKTECPCKKLGVECNPKNSKCVDGVRYVPVKLLDIAGLVPGAHKGKGLGNQFLSDIMEADALIHVVDISGGTDPEGNPIEPGSHDPVLDVEMFVQEIDYWIKDILMKVWSQISRKAETSKKKIDVLLAKQLTGLKITHDQIKRALKKAPVDSKSSEEDILKFVEALREQSKPILIAANKIDVPKAEKNLQKLQETEFGGVACSAESELALRRASKKGLIEYNPGQGDFKVMGNLGDKQKKALNFIKTNVLKKYGSTGVQNVINRTVFDMLDMIVVYPVANMSKFSDTKGNVLPDAHLVEKGTTLKEFAEKVHSTMAEHFVGGLDIQKKKIGSDYVLEDGDVVEILFKK